MTCLCGGANSQRYVSEDSVNLIVRHRLVSAVIKQRCTYDACFSVNAKSNARLRFFCCQFYFPCYTGLSIPADTMQHWWRLEKALLAVTC